MTTQPELDFLLGVYRPLLTPVETTVFLGDCTEQHVRDLVDEGQLLALNIAARPDGMERTLRIARYSAEHRGFFPQRPFVRVPWARLLPHNRPNFWRREVAQLLGCTEQHVSNLQLAGPKTDNRALIYTSAVIQFLESREIQPAKI